MDQFPLSVAVPFPLSVNKPNSNGTPPCVACRTGGGAPVVVTVKELNVPAVKTAWFTLLIAGSFGATTVTVTTCTTA